MTAPTPPEPKPGEHDAVNIAMLRFAASMLEVRGFSNLAGMVRFSGDEITRLQARVAELEIELDKVRLITHKHDVNNHDPYQANVTELCSEREDGMRPLDDVLATARADIQYCSEIRPQIHPRTRRELEEWEAKLAASHCDPLWQRLPEVRQLLGRGEPEPIPLNRDGGAPADLEQLGIKLLTMPEGPKKDALRKQIDDALGVAPKPSPASPAMRALKEAVEALMGAMPHQVQQRTANREAAMKSARAALKLYRAELGEAADGSQDR